MLVGQLLEALRRLSDLYAAGGADAQSKQLNFLIDALSPDVDLSVKQLIADIDTSSKPKPKKDAKPAKLVDSTVVEKYLCSLKEAEDLDEISAVISIIKHDKIDKPHVFKIAAEFTGSDPRFKSTNDAFARIKGAFIEQKRFENKLKAAHLD